MRSLCLLGAMGSVSAWTIPQFNDTKCPNFWEFQKPHAKTFNVERDMPGYYYELAFHDVTQYPLCLSNPRCITSNKAVQTHPDGVKFVNDTWDLQCFGHPYPQELLFNVTDDPGYLRGYVPVTLIPFLPPGIIADMVFPDTVIDYKPGPDGWVVELQCVEGHFFGFHRVAFIGLNFYSKKKTNQAFREMNQSVYESGLYYYINQGQIPGSYGLKIVNHTDCPLEPDKTPWPTDLNDLNAVYV